MPKREQPVPGRATRHDRQEASEDPFRIFIHNDDVVQMAFLARVLAGFFLLPVINAEQQMHAAHVNGRAYVKTRPTDESQRKIG